MLPGAQKPSAKVSVIAISSAPPRIINQTDVGKLPARGRARPGRPLPLLGMKGELLVDL
jgi:hypothetical protein